ncbi:MULTISPECIES: PhzF family phenazine biosynthesis protein [unclassified Arcicella]|uniref:PhzF family phenazine biosynthesis protein n=1 Tax=unclassified Arcicella TaxID=2644986 RepID=UPI00285E4C85|nr:MULTISPECIES: PhzF family phenazine biosynthesis protein [unclassified Arcicella]MDR6563111.1 PhzF family phenazine biosynthesis protein [Arcicella sp. BE51]MDR6811738.1 PhzF family phenazine biosynthesis protein [Arcicella sp. BE140]MDR6823263.1 PhzF family phenazine biosynthesis protein [Arcicella sp. BE139]
MDNFQNITVKILNAFVDNEKGGNPAGVVLEADNLNNEQKLKIASKVGLSETAFVSNSNSADFKLDFFTPTRQIAHCGHATIATFSYLSQLGKINNPHSSKETIDGKREILIQGDLAFMEQRSPIYTDVEYLKVDILKSLGLNENDLLTNASILKVNTGNSFIIVPVANQTILKNIQPNFDLISQISDELDLIGFYVFCTEASNTERDATTRMFAPRYGIEEEAGTGMAAGPLACYLYDVIGIKKTYMLIEQGWFMNEPSRSLIIADVSILHDKITKIMVGGKGIAVKSITVCL